MADFRPCTEDEFYAIWKKLLAKHELPHTYDGPAATGSSSHVQPWTG